MTEEMSVMEWAAIMEKGEDNIFLKLRSLVFDVFSDVDDGGEFIFSYCLPDVRNFREALLEAWCK